MTIAGFKAKNHPQQTGARGALDEVDDRGTHPENFDPWMQRFRFTLDVAAAPHNAKCDRYFTREDDGLAQSWSGESVWCNPPYSNIRAWVEKAWAEWPTTNGIVMLLPANRVEQAWWQELVEPKRDRADSPLSIEFLPGRMRFIRPNATIGPKGDRPPFGCCLLIWREPLRRERPKTLGKRHGSRVIVWDGTGFGVAPDGTKYALHSEHIRPEPRAWWSERQLPKGRSMICHHPTELWATTKDQAIQAAEHDWRKLMTREPVGGTA